MDLLLTERQQRPPAHPKRGARLCRAPGVLLDLGEKSQYPLKSLRGVLGGSPLRPFLSASHLVVLICHCPLLYWVLCPPPQPLPCAPRFHFPCLLFCSSCFLCSLLSVGEGACRGLWVSLCTRSGVEGLLGTPVLTSEGSEVILGGMQPVSSRGPSHSGQHQSPCPGLRLEAVSHCGPLTELG